MPGTPRKNHRFGGSWLLGFKLKGVLFWQNLRNPSGHTQAARPLNILRLGFLDLTHQNFESLAGDLSFAWFFFIEIWF